MQTRLPESSFQRRSNNSRDKSVNNCELNSGEGGDDSSYNSQPIRPTSDDPNDMAPRTSDHLLLHRRNLAVPLGVFTMVYSRKQWRHAEFLVNCFWCRWISEYVPTLQQRHKRLLNRRDLGVNDLVLVVDNTVPRCPWLLGRITKVFSGEDSRVRFAQVRTKNSRLVSTVTKLCLFKESTLRRVS